MPIPPMVKVKTQSMPMSVCRPAGCITDEAWHMVHNDKDGCHYEVAGVVNLVGFALSDTLASDAGNYYRRLCG